MTKKKVLEKTQSNPEFYKLIGFLGSNEIDELKNNSEKDKRKSNNNIDMYSEEEIGNGEESVYLF